jgi:hypothetical protein
MEKYLSKLLEVAIKCEANRQGSKQSPLVVLEFMAKWCILK